jgi:hypothetical protein
MTALTAFLTGFLAGALIATPAWPAAKLGEHLWTAWCLRRVRVAPRPRPAASSGDPERLRARVVPRPEAEADEAPAAVRRPGDAAPF